MVIYEIFSLSNEQTAELYEGQVFGSMQTVYLSSNRILLNVCSLYPTTQPVLVFWVLETHDFERFTLISITTFPKQL